MTATTLPSHRSRDARTLWGGVMGLAVVMLGTMYDQAWHRRHPTAMGGTAEVLQAHWLILAGILTVVAALLAGTRTVARSRSVATAIRVALLGAAAMLAGFALDTAAHVRRLESPFGHTLISLGFMLVMVMLAAALLLLGLHSVAARRRPDRSSTNTSAPSSR